MIKNIVANFFGRFWGIFSNFLFIPLYIDFLGFDNYSLISFTLIIAGVMGVIDAGLSGTLSREFARADRSREDKVGVFRTLETVYFLLMAVSVLIVFLITPFVVDTWLYNEGQKYPELVFYIRIVAIEICLQLLFRFYKGGLLGLEKQVVANVWQIAWGVVRNGLIVLPIFFYPNLEVFFLWQLGSSIVFALFLKGVLSKSFGMTFLVRPGIDWTVLKGVWKFAGGILLIALIAAINTQLDKFAISSLVSFENLGFYTLALTVARISGLLINPISVATLPRLTTMFSGNRNHEATVLYNKINMIVIILIFTIMFTIMFYGEQIIWVWTGNMELAKNASPLASVLVFGYAMLSLQTMPYNIALANGYTKLNNIIGVASLFLTIPSYIFATKYYGALGAAYAFSIIQTLITLVYVFLIYKKYLVGVTNLKFYARYFFFPLVLAFVFIYPLSRTDLLDLSDRILSFVCLGGLFGVSLVAINLILVPKRSLMEVVRIGVAKKTD